jgi:lysylphosphatidylglycerol synthetase-like protein (DUF2156 family)
VLTIVVLLTAPPWAFLTSLVVFVGLFLGVEAAARGRLVSFLVALVLTVATVTVVVAVVAGLLRNWQVVLAVLLTAVAVVLSPSTSGNCVGVEAAHLRVGLRSSDAGSSARGTSFTDTTRRPRVWIRASTPCRWDSSMTSPRDDRLRRSVPDRHVRERSASALRQESGHPELVAS